MDKIEGSLLMLKDVKIIGKIGTFALEKYITRLI